MYNSLLNIWSIIIFLLFITISIIHLVRCYQGKEGLADISKFFLMPALLLFFTAFVILNLNSFSLLSILIILGLVFSFLGDFALVFDLDKSVFAIGILFFAIAQLSYIAFAIIKLLAVQFPFVFALAAAIVYTCILVYQFMRMKKQLGGMARIVILYGIFLASMSWFFVVLAFANTCIATIWAATGSVFFLISDSMLAYSRFMGVIRKGRFFVMLTYILAEALIVLGAIGMIS